MEELLKESAPLILFGCICYAIYVYFFLKKRGFARLDLAIAIAIIATGGSIVGGLKVIMLSFDHEACKANLIEQIYIFFGGFAVMWVGVQDIVDKIKAI